MTDNYGEWTCPCGGEFTYTLALHPVTKELQPCIAHTMNPCRAFLASDPDDFFVWAVKAGAKKTAALPP